MLISPSNCDINSFLVSWRELIRSSSSSFFWRNPFNSSNWAGSADGPFGWSEAASRTSRRFRISSSNSLKCKKFHSILKPRTDLMSVLIFFTGAVSWKVPCLVLISVEHRIKINRQSVFSFSITCLVLQIFTVLKYGNSLWCHLLTHTKYKLYFAKQEILFKLTSRIYSNFTRV